MAAISNAATTERLEARVATLEAQMEQMMEWVGSVVVDLFGKDYVPTPGESDLVWTRHVDLDVDGSTFEYDALEIRGGPHGPEREKVTADA